MISHFFFFVKFICDASPSLLLDKCSVNLSDGRLYPKKVIMYYSPIGILWHNNFQKKILSFVIIIITASPLLQHTTYKYIRNPFFQTFSCHVNRGIISIWRVPHTYESGFSKKRFLGVGFFFTTPTLHLNLNKKAKWK